MRFIIAITLALLCLPTVGHAGWYDQPTIYHHQRHWQNWGGSEYRIAQTKHHRYKAVYSPVAGNCARAAALGGPCGCIAMKHAGIDPNKVRYWLVANWRADFFHTTCHAGAAALWGNRHVEIVTECKEGNAITIGPYGVRATPIGRLSFVQPQS